MTPRRVSFVQQRLENGAGQDLLSLVMERAEQPGLFEQLQDVWRQGRGAAVSPLESFDGQGQLPVQGGGADLVVSQQLANVGIGNLQQLEQQVFQFHIIVGLGHAEFSGRFHPLAAIWIELVDEGLQVDAHGSIFPFVGFP